jgi:hypothetical protein
MQLWERGRGKIKNGALPLQCHLAAFYAMSCKLSGHPRDGEVITGSWTTILLVHTS